MGFLDKLFGIDDARNAASNAASANRTEANSAFNYADSTMRPYYEGGTQAFGKLGDFLGLNGAGNQSTAFTNYQMSPDVQFRMGEGIRAIDNSSAARTGGVLSGGLLKRLQEYGTGVATQDYGNYLTRLLSTAGMGQQAGNTMTGARYNSANLTTGANTAEGNAIANAELAGGNILGNIIGQGLGFLGGFGGGNVGFNAFNRPANTNQRPADPWYGIR